MKTEEVKEEIERRTKEAYEKMFLDVEIQLKKEKEAALNEARRKEVSLVVCSILRLCLFGFLVLEYLLKLKSWENN